MEKSKRRFNVIRNINVCIFVFVVVTILNLLFEIMNNDRESIKVIQVETQVYNNPMGRPKKAKTINHQISIEDFCNVLNEIEGKEMYYINEENKIALIEYYEKDLSVKQKSSTKENYYKNYTTKDIELLANVMYIEVEQYINKEEAEFVFKLVGSVILNRVASADYKNTLEGVIWDNTQYAQSTLDKIYKKEIPDKVYKWAEELLRDGALGPENLIFQSETKQGSEVYFHYGNQYFCLR